MFFGFIWFNVCNWVEFINICYAGSMSKLALNRKSTHPTIQGKGWGGNMQRLLPRMFQRIYKCSWPPWPASVAVKTAEITKKHAFDDYNLFVRILYYIISTQPIIILQNKKKTEGKAKDVAAVWRDVLECRTNHLVARMI